MNLTIAKDFLKDFENEEFFAKNFRVRPISGVTGSGNDERLSEHISRNNLAIIGQPEPTDDDETYYLEVETKNKK